MKVKVLAVLGLLLAGCNNNTPSGQNTPNSTAQGTSSDASAAYTPAKTPEELAENYKAAIASGNTAAIEKMIHWEGTENLTQESKDTMMKLRLGTGSAGKGTTATTTLHPPAPDRVNVGQLLPITHVMDYEVRNESGSHSTSAAITQVDGHYYFYFFIYK